MKRTTKSIAAITAMIVLLVIGTIFFLFTNTGVGIIEIFNNWKQDDPSIPSQNEIVMPPDSKMEATSKTGTIVIQSRKGLKRYYTFDGVTRSVVMIPRPDRWYGSLGMYYPGPGSHWMPRHNGISRGVLQEGQQHFASINEAMEWLRKASGWYPTVYRDDGLVVGYGKELQREQINVDVWQIYIAGQKPTKLEGSDNSAIKTSWDNTMP